MEEEEEFPLLAAQELVAAVERHPQNPPPCLKSWRSPTKRTPQHLRRTEDGCLLTRTVLNMLLSKNSSKEFCKITILIQMINTFSHGTVAVNGTVAAGRGTVAGGVCNQNIFFLY